MVVLNIQAPRYFNELRGKEDDPYRFLKLSLVAYSAAALVYFSTIVLAYLLFGEFLTTIIGYTLSLWQGRGLVRSL